jgi:chromosome segregation ATPase
MTTPASSDGKRECEHAEFAYFGSSMLYCKACGAIWEEHDTELTALRSQLAEANTARAVWKEHAKSLGDQLASERKRADAYQERFDPIALELKTALDQLAEARKEREEARREHAITLYNDYKAEVVVFPEVIKKRIEELAPGLFEKMEQLDTKMSAKHGPRGPSLVQQRDAAVRALKEALELAGEGIGYTSEYFVQKWKMNERFDALEAQLRALALGGEGEEAGNAGNSNGDSEKRN